MENLPNLPNRRYSVIYADPPWAYRQCGETGLRQRSGFKVTGFTRLLRPLLRDTAKKPDETRKRIVDLLGDVPRIELFARQRADGWDAWGSEAPEE